MRTAFFSGRCESMNRRMMCDTICMCGCMDMRSMRMRRGWQKDALEISV